MLKLLLVGLSKSECDFARLRPAPASVLSSLSLGLSGFGDVNLSGLLRLLDLGLSPFDRPRLALAGVPRQLGLGLSSSSNLALRSLLCLFDLRLGLGLRFGQDFS